MVNHFSEAAPAHMYQVDFIVFDEAAKAPKTKNRMIVKFGIGIIFQYNKIVSAFLLAVAHWLRAIVCFIGDTKQCKPNRTSTNDDPK